MAYTGIQIIFQNEKAVLQVQGTGFVLVTKGDIQEVLYKSIAPIKPSDIAYNTQLTVETKKVGFDQAALSKRVNAWCRQ